MVVTYWVKVKIFKQFTTLNACIIDVARCYLLSKGKDFQAIHNRGAAEERNEIVVTYWVKVKIFKQFTTNFYCYVCIELLLLTE